MEHSQAGFHWILSELGAPRQATALQMCREVIENLSGRHPRTVLLNTVAPEPPLSGTYKVDGRKVARTWNPKQPIFKWMFGETTVSQVKVWNHPSETTILYHFIILNSMFRVPGKGIIGHGSFPRHFFENGMLMDDQS